MERRRAAGSVLRGCALLAPLLAGACAGPGERAPETVPVRGPLPLRSNGPIAQEYPAFRPRRADVLDRGASQVRFVTAYSSIFENGTSPNGSITLDGEMLRASALLRRGLGARTDVEVELAAFYATSGFLDDFIEAWHSALGLPNSGRDERPDDQYEMQVWANGELAYELEGDEVGLGDLPITLTHQLVEEHGGVPGVALQALVELPTGDESRGFGNGALDWGVGLAAELTRGDWTFGGGASWIDRTASDGFDDAGLEVIDPLQGWLSAEWRTGRALSVLSGLRYEQAVSDSLGIEELGGDVLELDLGVGFDLPGGSRLALGLSEDLIAASGPDFTAFLAFTASF